MRNQGSFFISCIGDVVPVPPHLPKDTQRLEYLRKKGYFGETPFSDDLVVRVMTGALPLPLPDRPAMRISRAVCSRPMSISSRRSACHILRIP